MKRFIFIVFFLAFAGGVSYAQNSLQGRVYNVRQFGCKGDNSTNDTTCFATALATVTANGGELFVPSGTYLTDPMTTTANSIIIRGDGWGSIIKSRTTGALLTFDNSATTTHSITIRDIAFQGFGSGSGNNGIVVSGANERFNWKLSNVKFSAFGGTPFLSSGGAIFTSSWEDLDIDQPSGASGHAFDVNGAQTNVLKRTYVHNVATNKAAYRLRQGAWTLEAVNGIDSGTTANWGIFGQQTSDDGTDTYAQITFIGSNIEDWSATDGLIFRIGSFGSFINTKFDTLTTGTYRAIKMNFVDANTTGIFDAESGFALNGSAAWTNGVPVHSYGVPFVSIGSTEISSYYDTNLAATISMSYINTALNGAQSRSTINIPRISIGTSAGQGLDSHFMFATDNAYDIGTSSGQRPRNIFGGTSILMADGATTVGGQYWTITGGNSPSYAFNDGTITGRFQAASGAGYAQIGTTSAHDLKFLTGGTARWNVNSSGHLIVDSGSLTIGLAAGNRPTIGYFSTSVNVGIPGTSVGSIVFGNGTNSNTLTLQSGTTGASVTYTLPTADGTSGHCLKTNGSGVMSWGTCTSGTLSVANGGTGATTFTTNGVLYGNGTSPVQVTAAGGVGTLCLVSTNGAAPVFGNCSGSAATAWDALTAPSTSLTVAMSTNYTTFNWPTGTSTNNLFNLTSANSANGTGYILNVNTGTSSTVKPLNVTVGGTSNGVEMTAAGVFQAKGTGSIQATPASVSQAIQINDGAGLMTGGANAVIDLSTSRLTLGTASSQSGSVALRNATNANLTTIQPGTPAALTTLTLPAASATLATLALSEAFTNKTYNGLTVTSSTGTFTLTNGKTFSVANSLALAGTDSTTMTFPATTTTVAGLGIAQTFSAVQTINTGTTPSDVLSLDIAALAGGDATRDSHAFLMTGRSRVGGVSHTPQWKQFIDVTTAAGISQYTFSYQFDGGGYTPLVVFKDDGTVSATAFEGGGTALTDLNATELTSGTVPYARMPLNVKSACTCDGSTDDASALQTLVNTMVTGDTLSFQGCLTIKIGTQITIGNGSGTYAGTSSATASTVNDISIEGHNVTVEWTGSTTGPFKAAGPISRLRMRDIYVDMNGNSGIAFDLNHARLSEFRNLYVLANADYGLRIRAYQVWTPGDGANGNSFDNIWISSTTAGAKGFDIGDTDTCNACGTHLDVAQNTFRNLRARFDTGGGSYVASSIGMRLNFTDAGQCDDCIFAAVTGLSIAVPSGTLGASYPAGYLFNTTSLQASTASFAVTGTWTAVEKIGFNNYLIADGQTVPSDTNNNTYGTTSNGITWGLASDAGFISGLQLTWNSTSQIQIGTGVAQIQSNLQLLNVSSALTINPSLGASTWYYCYVYNNSGTPAGECVTTAPASAYFGTARSKTGDTSRRYVGAIKSNGSSQIYTFFHNPETGLYQWLEDTTASPFRVLSGGTATTETSVDLTPVAPATARMVQLRAIDTDSTRNIFLRASTGGANAVTVRVNGDLIIPMTCTSAQLVYYLLNGAAVSGGAFLDVMGFYDLR